MHKHLRTVITTATVGFALAGAPLLANADPVLFNFGAPDFAGPTPGTVSEFEVVHASGLTVTIGTDDLLYWDNSDELGRPDGFGVAGGYEYDEFAGQERLWLKFNKPVTVLAFRVSDFFNENEPSTTCDPAIASPAELSVCYLEQFEIRFNGSSPWFTFSANPDQYRVVTNGIKDVNINAGNVNFMEFMAPGIVSVPGLGTQYHDGSLLSILVEEYKPEPPPYPVPEPTTLFLLATGLAGLTWHRKRRLS